MLIVWFPLAFSNTTYEVQFISLEQSNSIEQVCNKSDNKAAALALVSTELMTPLNLNQQEPFAEPSLSSSMPSCRAPDAGHLMGNNPPKRSCVISFVKKCTNNVQQVVL